MPSSSDRVRRLREVSALVLGTAADWPSRRHVLRCYARLGEAVRDHSTIDLRVRSGALRLPCRMRRSDIFTLAEIFHERQYEIRTLIAESPLIIDAGANIGLASLWMSGRYPGARIHAFEPEPVNFDLLEYNLRSLPHARAERAALGNRNGTITLELSEHGAMHSVSEGRVADGLTVRLSRLDTYLADHGVPFVDLLKLDVEGAELSVLEGLGERIRDVGAIAGEVHERIADVPAFYKFLEDAGFTSVRRLPFLDGDTEGVHGFEASRG